MRCLINFQIFFLSLIMVVFYYYPKYGEIWLTVCSFFINYYLVSTLIIFLLYTQSSWYKNYRKTLYSKIIHMEYIKVLYLQNNVLTKIIIRSFVQGFSLFLCFFIIVVITSLPFFLHKFLASYLYYINNNQINIIINKELNILFLIVKAYVDTLFQYRYLEMLIANYYHLGVIFDCFFMCFKTFFVFNLIKEFIRTFKEVYKKL